MTDTIETKDSYEELIFKFLNHSSSSAFYGIAALGSLLFTILGIQVFNADERLADSGIVRIIVMGVASLVIGLLLWRHAVNKMDYKANLKELAVDIKDFADEDAKQKFVNDLNAYKKTGLAKARNLRFFSVIVFIPYAVFLAGASLAIAESGETNYMTSNTILYITVAGTSVLSAIITTIYINLKFKSKLKSLSNDAPIGDTDSQES